MLSCSAVLVIALVLWKSGECFSVTLLQRQPPPLPLPLGAEWVCMCEGVSSLCRWIHRNDLTSLWPSAEQNKRRSCSLRQKKKKKQRVKPRSDNESSKYDGTSLIFAGYRQPTFVRYVVCSFKNREKPTTGCDTKATCKLRGRTYVPRHRSSVRYYLWSFVAYGMSHGHHPFIVVSSRITWKPNSVDSWRNGCRIL